MIDIKHIESRVDEITKELGFIRDDLVQQHQDNLAAGHSSSDDELKRLLYAVMQSHMHLVVR